MHQFITTTVQFQTSALSRDLILLLFCFLYWHLFMVEEITVSNYDALSLM